MTAKRTFLLCWRIGLFIFALTAEPRKIFYVWTGGEYTLKGWSHLKRNGLSRYYYTTTHR